MVQFIELVVLAGLAVFGMVMLFGVILLGSLFLGEVFGEDGADAVGVIGWTGFGVFVLMTLVSHSVLLGCAMAGLTWFVLASLRVVYRELKRPVSKRQPHGR